jgi:hypothetical protein
LSNEWDCPFEKHLFLCKIRYTGMSSLAEKAKE